MNTFAFDHGLPCHNPNCRSFGKPHPNCTCYSGGGPENIPSHEHLAEGGVVGFCSKVGMHKPTCPYYMAEGGPINTKTTYGHAAVKHGLLGLLKNVGHAKLQEPEKHNKLIQEAQHHWSRLQDPEAAQADVPKTQGVRLANNIAEGDHEKASELMNGHPMFGEMGKSHLTGVMGHLGKPLMESEPNATSMRASSDYLHSAIKGHGEMGLHANGLFDEKVARVNPDDKSRQALKDHLRELQDPEKLMEIAGALGHYMPEHATEIAASAAQAVNYLSSIEPRPTQLASLDKVMQPDKASQFEFDRQLDIAQKPTLVFQHMKDGTLIPQDMTTLKTLYPGLYGSMSQKVGESLIHAKTKGKTIPYKQKMALSLFLGEDLDSTLTPQSLQAIMKSQGPQQAVQQAEKAENNKASGAELTQMNKVDALSQTPLQARQASETKEI